MDCADPKKSKSEKRFDRLQHSKETCLQHKLRKQQAEDTVLLGIIEENDNIFNVFGTPGGKDTDIAVLVTKSYLHLKPHQLVRLCSLYPHSHHITEYISAADVDVNLVYTEDGRVVWVAHGTVWETNNAILAQYADNEQYHPCMVTCRIDPTAMDTNTKLHRAIRNILSMFTRSAEHRAVVKKAMKHSSSLQCRLDTITTIVHGQNTWAANRDDNSKISKQLKRACYQTIQALCLLSSVEIFDKLTLARIRPELKVFLYYGEPTSSDYTNLYTLYMELVAGIYTRATSGLIELNSIEE